MKFQLRISGLLFLIAITAVGLAIIRDMPERRIRDTYARQEAYWQEAIEIARQHKAFCLSRPAGTPYPIAKKQGGFVRDQATKKPRPCRSWADEAVVHDEAIKNWLLQQNVAREQRDYYQRRMILPF